MLRYDSVADGARRQGYLEGEPVFRLSDVEHISARREVSTRYRGQESPIGFLALPCVGGTSYEDKC